MRGHRSSAGICVLGLLFTASAACADRPAPIAPPKRIPPMVQPASGAGEPVDIATLPRELRRAVVEDAAKRLGVAASAVVLGGAERVTWNDGALGCPQPGQMYTQATVEGYRLVAQTASDPSRIVYHTDSKGYVVACNPSRSAPLHDASQPGIQPRQVAPDR
jgi:hypothetical protein